HRLRRLGAGEESLGQLLAVAPQVLSRNRRIETPVDPDRIEEWMPRIFEESLPGELRSPRPARVHDPGPAGEAPGARPEPDVARNPGRDGGRGGALLLDALGERGLAAPRAPRGVFRGKERDLA